MPALRAPPRCGASRFWIDAGPPPGAVRGRVRRGVVDDDDLERRLGLRERGSDGVGDGVLRVAAGMTTEARMETVSLSAPSASSGSAASRIR
jgi:hypothetical protein